MAKPKIKKARRTKRIADRKPKGGPTRPASAPLDEVVAAAYNAVQPERFKGSPRTAIDQAVSDPDVEDTKGGQ
jgi:hypothetical protein